MSNSEYDRGKQRENQRRAEVIKSNGQSVPIRSAKIFLANDRRRTTDDALLLLPNRDVISIGDRNEIQQPRDNHEFRSVIGSREGNRTLTPIHCQ